EEHAEVEGIALDRAVGGETERIVVGRSDPAAVDGAAPRQDRQRRRLPAVLGIVAVEQRERGRVGREPGAYRNPGARTVGDAIGGGGEEIEVADLHRIDRTLPGIEAPGAIDPQKGSAFAGGTQTRPAKENAM